MPPKTTSLLNVVHNISSKVSSLQLPATARVSCAGRFTFKFGSVEKDIKKIIILYYFNKM